MCHCRQDIVRTLPAIFYSCQNFKIKVSKFADSDNLASGTSLRNCGRKVRPNLQKLATLSPTKHACANVYINGHGIWLISVLRTTKLASLSPSCVNVIL